MLGCSEAHMVSGKNVFLFAVSVQVSVVLRRVIVPWIRDLAFINTLFPVPLRIIS